MNQSRTHARTDYDYLITFLKSFLGSKVGQTKHRMSHNTCYTGPLFTGRMPSITSDGVKFWSFHNSNPVAINLLLTSDICQTFSYIVIPVYSKFLDIHLTASY